MSKISIDVNNGILYTRFTPTRIKLNSLSELALYKQTEPEVVWTGPEHKISRLMEICKEEGFLVDLSTRAQKLTGLSRDGVSEQEIELEKEWAQSDPSYALDAPEDFELDIAGVTKEPYNYQRAGVYYGTKVSNGRCIIGDEPGLGKTLQAILIAAYYRNDWPVVVSCPVSLLYNWKYEFLDAISWLREDDIHIIDSASKSKPRGLITICTYHQLWSNKAAIADYFGARGVLIVDEAQAGANIESLRGAAIVEQGQLAKRFLPTSGTPLLSKAKQLWPVLTALDPVRYNDYKRFARRYCEGYTLESGAFYDDGANNISELMREIRANYMVRRRKTVVLPDLPAKSRRRVYLKATSTDLELESYIEQVNKFADKHIADGETNLTNLTRLIKEDLPRDKVDNRSLIFMYKQLGLEKLGALKEYFNDVWKIAPDEKHLIFFHNKDIGHALLDEFNKANPDRTAVYMDDTVSPKKRFELNRTFQTDENCTVAILSNGTGSEGLTWTAASRSYVTQIPFTAAMATQIEDRTNRISQESDTITTFLASLNPLDRVLWEDMVGTKSMLSSAVLDGIEGQTFEEDDDSQHVTSDSFDFVMGLARAALEKRKGAL